MAKAPDGIRCSITSLIITCAFSPHHTGSDRTRFPILDNKDCESFGFIVPAHECVVHHHFWECTLFFLALSVSRVVSSSCNAFWAPRSIR